MDSEPVLGIDLGTTNSEVAILSGGRPEVVGGPDNAIVPSCVGLDVDGNVIVGIEARNQLAAAPERTAHSVKRLMGSDSRVALGDREYSPPEISAFILKALRTRAEEALGRSATRAVVTVPAYFTDAQRQATREAGEIAGLDVVRIINEPTAAALSYGERREEQRKLLVYDLGGGTFDVSIVSVEDGVVEVLASTGDNKLGGDDFDAAIVAVLNGVIESELGIADAGDDAVLQARIRNAAEAAKIELSTQPYVVIEEDHVGTVDGIAKHLSHELSRSDFEAAIEDMLLETLRSVTTALNDANVRPSELDRVLLVGGSTRIPRITELLRERLGHEPHGEIDPDLCVALGAGVQAGVEMGADMQAILVDITPYTFGMSCIGEVYGMPSAHQFVPIIRRNSRLPATRSDIFFKVHEEQRAVDIDVYQGEDPDSRRNVRIGTFHFEDLDRDAAARDKGILVTYSLDLDGILHVRAVERMTGREIRGSVESPLAGSTPEELQAARERIGSEWGDDGSGVEDDGLAALADILDAEEHRDVASVLRRAGDLRQSAPEDDLAELIELTEQLREAVGAGDPDAVLSAKQNLDELLYYLE